MHLNTLSTTKNDDDQESYFTVFIGALDSLK